MRFAGPGTVVRRPRSSAVTPARAISSAEYQTPGSSTSPSSMPATRLNSVFVGPGQRAVAVTPVPRRSVCSASVKFRTNAFVAAYVA